ncbi:ATP-dependent RNA helicase Prh1 [Coleophoma crateriformis]|uniref:RNA helicase n=1 Tax=Coleophoma crateriformis TaxID=565419 RepID=A0A3D8RJK9_9HELO|nr:ATP-dependent RNA helicase Prh1 [Coleophoma crateriformis]
MPPKLHNKFQKDAEPAQNIGSHSSTSGPAATKKSPAHHGANGVKRMRDGSPKQNSKPQGSPHTNGLKELGLVNDVKSTGSRGTQDSPGLGKKRISSSGSSKGEQITKRNGEFRDKAGPSTSNRDLERTAAKLLEVRKTLPIWAKKADIRWSLRNNDVLLLVGETGSGKSTQVPQFLYTEPWCKKQTVKVQNKDGILEEVSVGGVIAVTEPRRIAATTLAQRVAREVGSHLPNSGSGDRRTPGKVGYSVRFDSNLPVGYKIKFVTEGTLLQEMLRDPHLRQYSAVVVDEIHERSVDVDLIAGFLRQIVHGDKSGRGGVPLKVVIMSATLDLGGLESYFSRPETVPEYEPGKNHQRVFAEHLLEDQRLKLTIGDDQSRRTSTDSESSYPSWGGIDSSDEADANSQLTDGNEDAKQFALAQKKKSRTPEKVSGIPDGDIHESGVAVEYVQGRAYDVEVLYRPTPTTDYMESMLKTILQIHTSEPLKGAGDILAFLTGQEEIEALRIQLEHYAGQLVKSVPRMKILPLYGSLPASAQQEAFEKVKEKFTRKIVLATNIAETSVTVSGVRYVVDCGKAKVKQYRPRLGMESLLAKPISKVSAIQRKGRAGREGPGKCYRIYTENDYSKLDMDELPEILRSDVIEAVLKMKARGVDDVLSFPLMDSPDLVAMEKALLQLHLMGAITDDGKLSDTGKKMAAYPLPATYGRVLIAAAEPQADCLLEAIDVISCLTADAEIFMQAQSEEERDDIGENRKDLQRREGDVITYLTTVQRYAAEQTDRTEWCKNRLVSIRAMKMAMTIRKQLRTLCVSQKLLKDMPPSDPQPFEPISPERAEVLLRTFLVSFATKTAVLAPDGSYLTTQGRNIIAIHPSSVLHGQKKEAIMFLEHVWTAKNYAKKVSAIQANWIVEALGV